MPRTLKSLNCIDYSNHQENGWLYAASYARVGSDDDKSQTLSELRAAKEIRAKLVEDVAELDAFIAEIEREIGRT